MTENTVTTRAITPQLRDNGHLRHLLTLAGLDQGVLTHLLERSQSYVRVLGEPPPASRDLAGITVANLFTEPSTRTRVSFELAAKRLGADVVNLELQLSSRVKGESMLDTIYTLEALHVDVLVIRDAEEGIPGLVADHVRPHVSVLSAGEAHVAHPTQGLLDALTIQQRKPDFSKLAVAIVGDVRHSRVARSAYHILTALGVGELRIVAPPVFMPEPGEFPGCARHTTAGQGPEGCGCDHDAAHPEGTHEPGILARRGSLFREVRPDAGAAAAGEAGCHRHASTADESGH